MTILTTMTLFMTVFSDSSHDGFKDSVHERVCDSVHKSIHDSVHDIIDDIVSDIIDYIVHDKNINPWPGAEGQPPLQDHSNPLPSYNPDI